MFAKGNQYGRGRPKISLNKPELLLPIIFQKAHINWANDFTLLYKIRKEREFTKAEQARWNSYLDLMPYLCTKVNIKELDSSKFTTEADNKAMSDQTKSLIEALEGMNDPKSSKPGKEVGLANRPPQIPPTA
jgi:hypothetical protein